ncbi:MAG: glycosyltransferase family 4 protein [Bacteriovorax sp.]|nr:glycosyltransferase family 4 protein [Bacteriovorax sp.]
MKVYLDCSPLTNTQVSGIGVYNKNLFLGLKNHLHADVFPVLKWSRLKKAVIVEEHLNSKVKALPPFLFNKEIVYHGTDHKLNTKARGPKIVTIHDMQPFTGKWLDPKFAQRRIDVITRVLKSDVQRIIAISHFTKKEIIKYFPEIESKIDVVYHGYNFKTSTVVGSEVNVIKNIAKERPFLFFVGNLEERKNLINQLKAFEIMKERHKDLIFILSGKEGFNFKEISEYITYSKYKKDIFITGYLSEADKNYALENTSCLMFASWYEGFGIPVIEALSTNTNIIISRGSALDEIGKNYCYQCNPKDPADIACSVEIIMEKGNLKKVELDSWKSEWSWEKCAAETIKVYKKSFDYI